MADNINLIILLGFFIAMFIYIVIPFIEFLLSGGKKIKVFLRHPPGVYYTDRPLSLYIAAGYVFILSFLLNIIISILKDILFVK